MSRIRECTKSWLSGNCIRNIHSYVKTISQKFLDTTRFNKNEMLIDTKNEKELKPIVSKLFFWDLRCVRIPVNLMDHSGKLTVEMINHYKSAMQCIKNSYKNSYKKNLCSRFEYLVWTKKRAVDLPWQISPQNGNRPSGGYPTTIFAMKR